MNKKLIGYTAAIFAALVAMNAQAIVFQGQRANGAFDPNCTVGASANQCVMYWDALDGIEILNNWDIGNGLITNISSAIALADTAGFAATGVKGWVLPTGQVNSPAGSFNQYLSIWNQLGGSISGLQGQFANVVNNIYWTSSSAPQCTISAFSTNNGNSNGIGPFSQAYATAVHIGAVPLPSTGWLLISSIGGLGVFARKRKA